MSQTLPQKYCFHSLWRDWHPHTNADTPSGGKKWMRQTRDGMEEDGTGIELHPARSAAIREAGEGKGRGRLCIKCVCECACVCACLSALYTCVWASVKKGVCAELKISLHAHGVGVWRGTWKDGVQPWTSPTIPFSKVTQTINRCRLNKSAAPGEQKKKRQ